MVATISKFDSLCFVLLMFHHYYCQYGRGIPLEPAFEFGHLTAYHTRTRDILHILYDVIYHLLIHFSVTGYLPQWCMERSTSVLPSDLKCHEQFVDIKTDTKLFFVFVTIVINVFMHCTSVCMCINLYCMYVFQDVFVYNCIV